jgi:hypothetical protein
VSASSLAVVDHQVSTDFANFLAMHAEIPDVDAHAQVQNDRTSVGDQVSCNFMKVIFVEFFELFYFYFYFLVKLFISMVNYLFMCFTRLFRNIVEIGKTNEKT